MTRTRFWIAATIALLVALLVGAGAAGAHAYLVRSDPAEGTYVATAPPRVTLWFTEGLEKNFSRIRVVNQDNAEVTAGPTEISTVDPKSMSVPLRPLPNGVYTVIWDTLSTDDGHSARGAFAFAVGDPSTATAPVTVSGVASSSTPPPV